ncbi:MAG: hypothetical protein LPJ89_00665 [Hymenobacteraceae bacterium]|nr:hypothetical protein [Hymenobacteraceae bacterium]MDX5397395.1 hypothetical protein [Hymenobacteraceae bacterium]MDX5442277.1 hypothetical protein [Hymenobacteraceae bacterium]MDX5513473.1 hypothetical protein [Hymenobacteraceae bacterium]
MEKPNTKFYSCFKFVLLLLVFGSTLPAVAQTDSTIVEPKQQLPTGVPDPASDPQTQPPVNPDVPQVTVEYSEDTPLKQEPEKQHWLRRERLFLGATGGLNFSSNNVWGNQFFVEFSPFVGYKISHRVALGPGVIYQYMNTSLGNFHNYGTKAFFQAMAFESVFSDSDQLLVHGEYEVLNVETVELWGNRIVNRSRVTLSSVLGGAAYRQYLSDRFASDLHVLYNFTNDGYSPYGPLVIRAALIYNFY